MRAFYEADASLAPLQGKTLGVIGYGNQGRAHALNLRDSGMKVEVASIRDQSAEQAEADGFSVLSFAEAVDRADVLALLIPDEVQRQVYAQSLGHRLRPGQSLLFAHGYNIHFGLIEPPPGVDVIMVAPRMIGTMVRESFTKGAGAPAFVAVAQDASGRGLETALAWAHGIGATRAGVLETTFAQETELDLFQEQALWPILTRAMVASFDFLVSKGFPPEMVALEMYGSGEGAEIFREMARVGFFKQMRLHSQTSQYGTLTRGKNLPFLAQMQEFMEKSLAGIRSGSFNTEWLSDQAAGYPRFNEVRAWAAAHPMNQAEEQMRALLPGEPE
jgi:ketol-acid reductoisomerase